MEPEMEILGIFIRLQEHKDIFRHKQAGLPADMGLTEVHCLDCIGRAEHQNVTKIAAQVGLSRAGASKIAKRLLDKGLIASYRDDKNKKEIYFLLTEAGRAVFAEHEKIHDRAGRDWLEFLSGYNQAEKAAILRFFREIDALWAKEKTDDT